jgi:RNA polymerase sigma-B factor
VLPVLPVADGGGRANDRSSTGAAGQRGTLSVIGFGGDPMTAFVVPAAVPAAVPAVPAAVPPAVPAAVPAAVAAGAARPATDADGTSRALLLRYADLPAGAPDRPRIRARIIELYLPMARHLARRFRNRGESLDDLTQVACVGLIKAVDGFDVNRGAAFTSYAIPMVVGELKRHFRDKGWDIRVPRRLQELRLEIAHCVDELCQRLGRAPTVADLAAELELSEDEIIEGLYSSQAYRTLSLDAPAGGNCDPDGESVDLIDVLGEWDRDIELVENREALRPMLAKLSTREQRIIAMRFFGNLTQSQIAAQLGISQMHVSRLLAQSLTKLRADLFA